MELVNISRPAKVQHSCRECKILEPGDTFKIESDGYDWLKYEVTTKSKITVQIVIDGIPEED